MSVPRKNRRKSGRISRRIYLGENTTLAIGVAAKPVVVDVDEVFDNFKEGQWWRLVGDTKECRERAGDGGERASFPVRRNDEFGSHS